MSEPDVVVQLVAAQRRRLIAAVMGELEERAYPHLSLDEQQALRRKVLQSVGSFSDFVIDVLRSSQSSSWQVNEEALRVLHEINSKV